MTVGTQPIWNKETISENLKPSGAFVEAIASDGKSHVTGSDIDAEKDALRQFSVISRKFIDSYSHLEQHVDRLSDELAAQTAEKEQQYEEKNLLAERLELILATLPSAVVVIDGHGRVQESNALAEDMLGLPLVGETWLNIISRSFAPRSDDGYEISLTDGRRVKVETRALGKQPGQIVLLTDLTETRRLQENQSREQRLSTIGKMMASLAHQIRTPLSSALLYSGHISSQKLNEDQQKRFHTNLQHSLKRLQRQVSDMLLFASGGVASKERFQLSKLIKALKADVNSYQLNKSVDVQFDNLIKKGVDKEILLFGNMQALLGAIANLIENSIHACSQNRSNGKLVDISVLFKIDEKHNIIISVSDNGCGISKSEQKQIFQPFYTNRARGTGLGLAVVNTVMNSFKGKISIESAKQAGSIVNLVLPCIHSDSFTIEESTENKDGNAANKMQQPAGGQ